MRCRSWIPGAVALVLSACTAPTVKTADLSRSCDVDDDCVIRTDVPCQPGCPLCEGVAVNEEGAVEFDTRLEAAEAACFATPVETCSPCASDDIRRTAVCSNGTCVAVE
jgi:hypothetical protein